MKKFALTALAFVFCIMVVGKVNAQNQADLSALLQQKRVPNQPLFQVKGPDYTTSPYTGMTKKHWKDAALYLLNGAFSYIDNIDDPMQFPKMQGKSYPRTIEQVPVEKLEGLCRTLFIAAPLLKDNPGLTIHGIKVADYYRHHLMQLINPQSPEFIKQQEKGAAPHQNLVEFGGLSVALFYIPEILFDPLPKAQQDLLAATMLSYGEGRSFGNNWKFFNILVLSFYKSKGYQVNEALLVDYLNKSLANYVGDGWYHDNPAYDYYSMWAFQMYGPLWSEFFGKKYYPEYAKKFMQNFNELKYDYPYMFSRDGKVIMRGRSMSYRMASIIPFPLMGLENDTAINYGWMRRIASGVLLQFLKDPDLMQDNIPTLGFYGAFEPAIQPYSCRGSVFWMAKAFLGLMIPDDNPFWNAKENEGAWSKELKKGTVYNKFGKGTDILITDYPNIGASEIRAWGKELGAKEPIKASENYNRLSYNSAFPWQADSVDGVVAMNYITKNSSGNWEPLHLYNFQKFEDGVYYRKAVLETHPATQFNLADIPLPNGILRVDEIASDTATALRLGHYALPQLKGAIVETTKTAGKYWVKIIDNGEYQLAMVPLEGWNDVKILSTENVHPQSKLSKVINVADQLNASQEKIYITLMLWKKSGQKWSSEELMPVKSYTISGDKKQILIKTASKNIKISFKSDMVK
ncbi:DUF2264 domain-containing protein [Chitinophagaceae bacterium LB-8]|uniref:DUF2264 domain-containing protein n=1 Tax=Paraflavisolibacter caeni TaxID=2982496 RepID=A0A9X2XX10_9BACT|nr:DUF2264 domain-containing protein [Paraflavisolibacter caeni]MCU7549243.1 DUF2264 domain-containing protein [Paraflavisolibacter caeni]